MRIVLTGGGSGGHVSPMLAVADALTRLDADSRFLYIGVRGGLEARLVPRAGIQLRHAPSMGMPGLKSPAMVRFVLTLSAGILAAAWHLVRFRPNVIVASGGYASAPAVFAASLLGALTLGIWRIPVYLHEQNAIPGRMNTLAARVARQIGVVHGGAVVHLPHPAVEVVGYPVRSSFAEHTRNDARAELGIPDDVHYVVVTGGSQGARTINRAMVDALPQLAGRSDLHIVHAAGTMAGRGYHAMNDTRARLNALGKRPVHYTLVEYLDNLPLHLAAANLTVIRAGAGSLVEACTQGVPAIVIPKANLPGDSQVANARELAAHGAIELLYEEPALVDGQIIEEVGGEELAGRILALIEDGDRRAGMVSRARRVFDREAANRIANRVHALGKGTLPPAAEDSTNHDPPETIEALPTSPTALRRFVEQTVGVRYERAFDHGPLREWQLDELPDLPYLRYRGAALLAHPSWPLRNEGVKLIGLTRHREKLPLILHLLTDRTPAPAWHRLLGGDFQVVGFVRRNALNALALLGVVNPAVREAIALAMDDPYYEVRATALKLVRSMIEQGRKLADDDEIVTQVRACTGDRNLEVRWEALDTFGHVGAPDEVLAVNRMYALEEKAPLREAVLRSYHALLDRFADDPDPHPWRATLANDLDRFALTSVAFHPHFPLKERFVSLQRRVREEAGG